MRDVSGWRECVRLCVRWWCETLSLGTTALQCRDDRRPWLGISGVRAGIPSVRVSLRQRNLVCNARKELTDMERSSCGFAVCSSCCYKGLSLETHIAGIQLRQQDVSQRRKINICGCVTRVKVWLCAWSNKRFHPWREEREEERYIYLWTHTINRTSLYIWEYIAHRDHIYWQIQVWDGQTQRFSGC